jgi:hypothetical protein
VGFGVPSADEGASALVPAPFDAGAPTTPIRHHPKFLRTMASSFGPAAAATAGEAFGNRRCPSTSANRRETRAHPRAIRIPARRRLAPRGGWPARPAGGERDRSRTHRSRRLNEHAHGCAEARTNRRRAPLVAADRAERRLENRRRHDPGQDRLTARRANVRTEGEIEVPSSRRMTRAEARTLARPKAKRNALFAAARRCALDGCPVTSSGREPRPG